MGMVSIFPSKKGYVYQYVKRAMPQNSSWNFTGSTVIGRERKLCNEYRLMPEHYFGRRIRAHCQHTGQ